jgi:hypothetical protein
MIMRPLTRNIVRTYLRATPEQHAQGVAWYQNAHELACELEDVWASTPGPVERGAGVIAALSPMIQWERNAALARKAYLAGVASGTYSANTRKATAILQGADPVDVLRGPKVTAFYAGIIAPEGTEVVCVDRHAHDVAVGRRCTDEERGALTSKRGYATFVRAYRRAADQLGMPANHLQAITWLVWRDEYRWTRAS